VRRLKTATPLACRTHGQDEPTHWHEAQERSQTGSCEETIKGIQMVRSVLIIVAAASLLLAGFTFAGGKIGLWNPLEPGDSGVPSVRDLDRPDSDGAPRPIAPAVAYSKPGPPVSMRLALLVALASLSLSVLPTLWRLPRRLDDYAWSVRKRIPRSSTGRANAPVASELVGTPGLSRAPPPQPTLQEPRSRPLSSPFSALARARPAVSPPAPVTPPERPRSRRVFAATTPVRARAVRSFIYEVRGAVVGLALAVSLGVAIGILAAILANG
jgi:hypothetical protein